MEGYASENYMVCDESDRRYTFKYHRDPNTISEVIAENEALSFLAENSTLNVSKPILTDSGIHQYDNGTFSRLLEFVPGTFLAEADQSDQLLIDFGRKVAEVSEILAPFENLAVKSMKHHWDLTHFLELRSWSSFIKDPSIKKLVDYQFDQYQQEASDRIINCPRQIIHGDLNDWNVLTEGHQITGIIDFGDMCFAARINELAIAMVYIMMNSNNPMEKAVTMFRGYSEVIKLSEEETVLLPYQILARLCQSICHANKRVTEGTDTDYVLVSQRPIVNLLKQWFDYHPEFLTNRLLGVTGGSVTSPSDELIQRREAFFSPAISTSYSKPIHMSRAAFQYMYGASGITYLDAYNNIPHVGHSHPKVTRAISKQASKLNTNTRYLYDSLAEYSEKLLSYFPHHLNKVFYVNSGSAASDLATRLARSFTQRRDMMVLENGYHGNTSNGIEISSYKFDGPGGPGSADHIHQLPLPKLYNSKYAKVLDYVVESQQIIADLLKAGTTPAAFIAEPISGCGGQVPIPPDFMDGISLLLKKNNILTIIDEVQVGFGRLGNHFWGFEQLGILPDIVVLGKPMGNGHPIGAVVTTNAISEAFANGMEFFSSFGGNPVSMEAGKAVLEVIEEENLQENARIVGDYWHDCLTQIQNPWIGDLRNNGLFMGIEFTDPASGNPGTDFAAKVKNQMKKQFILTSTDGPHNNVLKMKPPLCFSKENVDTFMEVFQKVMAK